jgi:prolyl-tRNA synthetase
MTVAHYQVIIVPTKYGGSVKTLTDSIAGELEARGLEVLVDDVTNGPDFIEIPCRVVVGEKNLAGVPKVELKRHGEKESRLVEAARAAGELAAIVKAELAELNR